MSLFAPLHVFDWRAALFLYLHLFFSMNNTIPAIIVAVALVAMAWLLANKQVTTINTLPASGTIQTVAEGHVTVSPDTVTLSLAIMKRAATSKEAYADVNTGIAALRAILKTA